MFPLKFVAMHISFRWRGWECFYYCRYLMFGIKIDINWLTRSGSRRKRQKFWFSWRNCILSSYASLLLEKKRKYQNSRASLSCRNRRCCWVKLDAKLDESLVRFPLIYYGTTYRAWGILQPKCNPGKLQYSCVSVSPHGCKLPRRFKDSYAPKFGGWHSFRAL